MPTTVGKAHMCYIDKLRDVFNMQPLEYSDDIHYVALDWSKAMYRNRTPDRSEFIHNPKYEEELAALPAGYKYVGENIAMLSHDRPVMVSSFEWSAYTLLRTSYGHCTNMLRDTFTLIGVGIHYDRQHFYLTQNFARHPDDTAITAEEHELDPVVDEYCKLVNTNCVKYPDLGTCKE